jgi:aminopeptidase N
LLAWERGRGWGREPAVGVPAEAAVSEAAQTDVTVNAPAGDQVLMTGVADLPKQLPGGRRGWHAIAASARDVSVSVGRFAADSATIAGVRVTAAVAADTVAAPAPDTDVTPAHLLAETRRSMTALAGLYGPFPYPSLVVTALPSLRSGGIEYPGAIMVGPELWHVVVPHETAHQYFYGMVGDDQARDPWLDEAFATYSEARVNGTESRYLPALNGPLPVGRSMQGWGSDGSDYAGTVYAKGAAALLTARQSAGGTPFDQALRCYVRANAWSVATPAALARGLAGLPAATTVLRRAGALP